MGIIENISLETKPDFQQCMKRITAWYSQEILDRPPVRFHHHNAQFSMLDAQSKKWENLRDRWFDTEYQVRQAMKSVENRRFNGETFPVFEPNLGPDVYSAFHGMELEFGEVTSWSHPVIRTMDDLEKIQFSESSPYWNKIEEMTEYALVCADNRFLVAYTDLHPGMDFAACWRGSENLCMDFYDNTEMVKRLIREAQREFHRVFDHFHRRLNAAGHPSVCWMNIPDEGKLHIPSCDFGALISPDLFNEYVLPMQAEEIRPMDRNIYHLDGRGVANHLDSILGLEDVHAIQWVQGVAEDQPIMQWIPLIRKIQDAGKAVIVDLTPGELEPFLNEVDPRGIFFWIGAESPEVESAILKRLAKISR